MSDKKILDVTCANRSIWFNKHHPSAVYCDIRKEHYESDFGNTQRHRTIDVDPDVLCDFTNLPFADNTFALCVFDPPHIKALNHDSRFFKAYGTLSDDWQEVIGNGFKECMRVLKPEGVLILKWADTSVSTPDLIKIIGQPLFGHRSGKKMGTHWLTFMKLPEVEG